MQQSGGVYGTLQVSIFISMYSQVYTVNET
jgi:hypothetical protein